MALTLTPASTPSQAEREETSTTILDAQLRPHLIDPRLHAKGASRLETLLALIACGKLVILDFDDQAVGNDLRPDGRRRLCVTYQNTNLAGDLRLLTGD